LIIWDIAYYWDGWNQGKPEKLKAVMWYPIPRTVQEVRSFLGLTGFYHKMIPNYASRAKSLTMLIRTDQNFMWAQEQKNTFDDLKTALTTAAVSGYPDFNQTFYQTTDASKPAVD
jgi:hypothetical protein